eukprot:Skav211330  [mRNA]  locus=scaffold3120:91073:95445:- [translate_table: standard]
MVCRKRASTRARNSCCRTSKLICLGPGFMERLKRMRSSQSSEHRPSMAIHWAMSTGSFCRASKNNSQEDTKVAPTRSASASSSIIALVRR